MNIEDLKCCGNCSKYGISACGFMGVADAECYCEIWEFDGIQKKDRKDILIDPEDDTSLEDMQRQARKDLYE